MKPPEGVGQIAIFRAADTIIRTTTTDTEGRARITLNGAGEYLITPPVVEAVDDTPVFWQSHWASLSFRLRREI